MYGSAAIPEVITIGSVLVDIFVHSQSFQLQSTDQGVILCQKYGDKVDVDSFEVLGGGGAGNTAVGFQRLGFKSAVIGELGRDSLAEVIKAELKKERVEIEYLIEEKKEQTGGSVILIGPDGGRTVMVHRGAASQLDETDIPWSILSQSRWLHLSSISGRSQVLHRLFSVVAEHTIGFSWNPGKAELELLAAGQFPSVPATILLVNQEEWQLLAPRQSQLVAQIPAIVVTNGKDGGKVLIKDSEVFDYESPAVESVDDTGAGDAFAVGFVAAYLAGQPWRTAARWGAVNAAGVVGHIGAKPGLLDRSELERIVAGSAAPI